MFTRTFSYDAVACKTRRNLVPRLPRPRIATDCRLAPGGINDPCYRRRVPWPEWWDWELELTPHLEKRMVDREFTEVDLRAMLERASGHRPDPVEGRFVIETEHKRSPWEVIVEPDEIDHLLVVVTAYPVNG